ncbi:MAG: oligopeptide:H+ symporter, partial [Pseudomonadota bacterium]
TIFYMGINLGGWLGPLLCGFLAATYGWHYGFGAAGVLMLLGLIQYSLTARQLGDAGKYATLDRDNPAHAASRRNAWIGVGAAMLVVTGVVGAALTGTIQFDARALAETMTVVIISVAVIYLAALFILGGLDLDEKKKLIVIMVLFIGCATFWSGFEQAGSSFNLFAQRYTDRMIGSYEIPAAYFQSLNSIFIIIFAPFFAAFWVWLGRRNLEPSTPAKFAVGILFISLGFLVMAGAAVYVAAGEQVLPVWLIMTYLLHTFGELTLSPVGLSATTKLAPKRYVGQMMGIWFLATSLGSLISGLIAGEFDAENVAAMPDQYMQLVLTYAGIGVLMLLLTKPVKKLMGDVR